MDDDDDANIGLAVEIEPASVVSQSSIRPPYQWRRQIHHSRSDQFMISILPFGIQALFTDQKFLAICTFTTVGTYSTHSFLNINGDKSKQYPSIKPLTTLPT